MFTTPQGRPIDPTNLTRAFTTLLRKAGLRRIRLLSRPGARCRDCSRSVSPDRSPNPPYRSLGNG
ncbi:hypothetical protein ACFW2Y_30525, partial [Streptomyces sp. NPDC058877]